MPKIIVGIIAAVVTLLAGFSALTTPADLKGVLFPCGVSGPTRFSHYGQLGVVDNNATVKAVLYEDDLAVLNDIGGINVEHRFAFEIVGESECWGQNATKHIYIRVKVIPCPSSEKLAEFYGKTYYIRESGWNSNKQSAYNASPSQGDVCRHLAWASGINLEDSNGN